MHIRRDNHMVGFWLNPVALEHSGGLSHSELRRGERIIKENRTSFLGEWMHVSTTEVSVPEAMTIAVTEDTLAVELSDGRTISVPLTWYPRLMHAMPQERDNWELIGEGIHWPDLDEDISIEGLLAGRKSGESRRSLQQWLEAKKEGRGLTLFELTAYDKEQRRSDGQ